MADLRPYGFSRRGPTRHARYTFDTKARAHLKALLGYDIGPVITIRNVERYLNDLSDIIGRMYDYTEGRLSARQQQQVRIIKRTQEWLKKVVEDLP